jgi:hypothetical protein
MVQPIEAIGASVVNSIRWACAHVCLQKILTLAVTCGEGGRRQQCSGVVTDLIQLIRRGSDVTDVRGQRGGGKTWSVDFEKSMNKRTESQYIIEPSGQ